MSTINFQFLQTGQKWDASSINSLSFNFATSTPLHWITNSKFSLNYNLTDSGSELTFNPHPDFIDAFGYESGVQIDLRAGQSENERIAA